MLDVNEQEIVDLAHNLKQEKLFIDSEKQQLRTLYEQVSGWIEIFSGNFDNLLITFALFVPA